MSANVQSCQHYDLLFLVDSSERVSLKSRTETETDKMLSIADQAPELLEEDVFVDVPIRTQDDSRSDEETEVF